MQDAYSIVISPQWHDTNGHMNVKHYYSQFDTALTRFTQHLGFDKAYRESQGFSIFTAEEHICYLGEVKAGQRIRITTQLYAMDAKRLHIYQTMYTDKNEKPAATSEHMILHVNLIGPKVVAMPQDRYEMLLAVFTEHQRLFPEATHVGRRIGLQNTMAAANVSHGSPHT
jgi:acyl-CoA thioesterase FadM